VCNEINCILDIVVKAISWPMGIGFQVFGHLKKYFGRVWNLRISLKNKWCWATIGRQKANNPSVL